MAPLEIKDTDKWELCQDIIRCLMTECAALEIDPAIRSPIVNNLSDAERHLSVARRSASYVNYRREGTYIGNCKECGSIDRVLGLPDGARCKYCLFGEED